MKKIELEAYDAMAKSRDYWQRRAEKPVFNVPCRWVANDDGQYETQCGEIHEFTFDGPLENKYKFCPYCGAMIIE